MTDKRYIIDAIKRIAAVNGGKAPGRKKFERETGIRSSDWYPYLWLRWGDALQEAGFSPNKLRAAFSDEVIIEKYIDLIREIKQLPVSGEVKRKSKSDVLFPSHRVFDRLGGKDKLIEVIAAYCREHPGHDDVLALCDDYTRVSGKRNESTKRASADIVTGFVYLIKSGRHYKIGRTNSLGRRERELAIKIPIPPKTIHSIETDDPVGVEAYWHRRFADKRGEGEWFDLTDDDVATFKRWKKIV
ncbi:MAG: GIY-YIG nuclease family protein [Sulfuricaulis sp.]